MEPDAASRVKQLALEAERLERSGDRAGAIAALRSALDLAPGFAAAHAHVAVLLQDAGDAARALEHFTRAAELRPEDARTWNNLAAALHRSNRFAEAEAAARRALQRNADYAWAHFNLGRALVSQHRGAEGIRALQAAADLDRANAMFWEALGTALLDDGSLAAASAALTKATLLDASRAAAWVRLGSAQLHLGRNEAGLEALRRAEALAPPDAAQMGSTRLVALHYGDENTREEIFEAHLAWARRYAPSVPAPQFANDRDPRRPLRIGYVSPRFHGASLAFVLEQVLASHDPRSVEVWCYASQAIDDEVTVRMRSRVAQWVNVLELDDEALARRMREDRIDIAVDLAGHTPGNRLLAFAHRPAPVCVEWLDYFDTSGLATMHAVISDIAHSPADDAQPFTEELVRLERIRFAYAAPRDAPDALPPPLARGAPSATLGSFNRMTKISPRTLRAWSAALDGAPGARLIVKNSALGHAADRAHFAERFRQHGVAPERVQWRGYSPHAAMMAEYNDVDVALDTFPYNGGITTLEALWMGRPVVTIAGDSLISRQSAAVLRSLDLGELVARDEREFAAIVAELTRDRARLAHMSAALRDRMRRSPVCDAASMARSLETACRSLWSRWLAGAL